MNARSIERIRRDKQSARTPLLSEDDPCTLLFTDVGGVSHTVVITNAAIAECLGRKPDSPMMVEECSDFVSAHRAAIIDAAKRSHARRGLLDGRIVLVAGDLRREPELTSPADAA